MKKDELALEVSVLRSSYRSLSKDVQALERRGENQRRRDGADDAEDKVRVAVALLNEGLREAKQAGVAFDVEASAGALGDFVTVTFMEHWS